MTVVAINGRDVTLSTGETFRWPMSKILPQIGQTVFASDLVSDEPNVIWVMGNTVPGHGWGHGHSHSAGRHR